MGAGSKAPQLVCRWPCAPAPLRPSVSALPAESASAAPPNPAPAPKRSGHRGRRSLGEFSTPMSVCVAPPAPELQSRHHHARPPEGATGPCFGRCPAPPPAQPTQDWPRARTLAFWDPANVPHAPALLPDEVPNIFHFWGPGLHPAPEACRRRGICGIPRVQQFHTPRHSLSPEFLSEHQQFLKSGRPPTSRLQ